MDAAPSASVELAKLHNDVIEAAMAQGITPLPARFGQRFASDAECRADVDRRARSLVSALARVADMVEMGILIAPVGGTNQAEAPDVGHFDATTPGAGKRYLSALRELERERQRWDEVVGRHLVALEEDLQDLVHDRASVEARRGVAAGVAHLVPRGSVSRYRELVQARAVPSQLRVVVTGPRAPYSFTTQEPQEAGGTILAD